MTDIKAKIIVTSISVLHRWKTRYAFDIEHFTIYGCDLLFLTLLSINIRIWRKWWENVKSLVLMSQYYRKERMVIEIYKLVHLVNGVTVEYFKIIVELLSLLQSPPLLPPNKFSLSIIEYVEHGGGGVSDSQTLRSSSNGASSPLSNAKSWISACIFICRCKFFK